MKVIIQRVSGANVKVNNETIAQINQGFLLLVGFTHSDNQLIVEKVVKKIIGLRIFEDNNGKINLAIHEVNGAILSVPQFTLYGNVKKGNRPSFINSAKADDAKNLYLYFNQCLEAYNIEIATGIFQADMQVSLVNDGPVTIIIDSSEL
ncbi:MAG: D-aminoacyl-tRNA deacylase [Erysipelotrichaceae bacterium]